MNGSPSLLLVPPTPSDDPISVSRPDSLSSIQDSKSLIPPRDSSETAIVSIYSMYGDDTGKNWSAQHTHRDAVNGSLVTENGKSSLEKPSFDSELSYYAAELAPKVPRSRAIDLQKAALTRNASPEAYFYAQKRPSSYAPPSTSSPEALEHRRAASETAGENANASQLPNSRSLPSIPPPADQSRSNSPRHKTDSLERDLPPLPPSMPSTPPRQRTPTPTQQRRPQTPQTPRRTPDFLTVPDGSPSSSASPPAAPLPLKHPPYVPGSQSKTSLVPSEGEDLDGFHVRNTYAQLEMSGVKGDGFVEGVERTRARIGDSRASQLHAENAIGDGSEKSQELDYGQIQVLSTVDRYGFYSPPSHERLVLLPNQPLLSKLGHVQSGPPNAHPSPPQLDNLPKYQLPPKETTRIAKWMRMLVPDRRDQGGNIEFWTVKLSKEHKLRERTYKGIPDRWRAAAWEVMISRFSRSNVAELAQLGRDYRDGLDRPSNYDIQIDLDVPRTISGHIMFRTRYGQGQRSLFHVLHCFSLRCSTCGYVQGMGPIAATLLCYFEPERVYASLVRLHDAYSLHTLFSPGFPGLLESIYVQERITETMMPDVYKAFKRNMISTTSYATKWYITLFSNSVPFQTQLRLWDAFLLEGQDVFVAVAVAIVWVYRDHITSSSANFETVLSLLSSFFVPQDEDVLMRWIEHALGNQSLRSNMKKWREDWQNLVRDGKEGSALL